LSLREAVWLGRIVDRTSYDEWRRPQEVWASFSPNKAAISFETSGFTAQTACRAGIFEGIVRSVESSPAPTHSTLGTGCGGQTIFGDQGRPKSRQ
jgi:hypothetical protein